MYKSGSPATFFMLVGELSKVELSTCSILAALSSGGNNQQIIEPLEKKFSPINISKLH